MNGFRQKHQRAFTLKQWQEAMQKCMFVTYSRDWNHIEPVVKNHFTVYFALNHVWKVEIIGETTTHYRSMHETHLGPKI